jgi:hypothetical protein
VAATKMKRLADELAEEKHRSVEATTQFNTLSTGRSILYVDHLRDEGLLFIF